MADNLREYLIALGFKVDDQAYQRFQRSINASHSAVVKLGAAVVATGAAIGVSVVEISDQLEELYYAAQRAGSSATNLRSFWFGARQIGIEAGEAQAAVERLRIILRTEPGKEAYLNQLGIATRDANKQLLDTTVIARGLVKVLKTMPDFQATIVGGMFGLDPQLLFQWQKAVDEQEAAEKRAKERRQEAGVDMDKLSEASVRLQNSIRELAFNFETLYLTAVKTWQPLVQWTVEAADQFVKYIQEADKATGGWSTTLGALAITLTGVAGGSAILTTSLGALGIATGGVLGTMTALLGVMAKISLIFGAAAAGGWSLGRWLHSKAEEAGGAEAVGRRVGDWLQNNLNDPSSIKGVIDRWLGSMEGSGTRAPPAQAPAAAPSSLPGAPTWNNRGQQAMDYFMRLGWTREQAAGIVANLQAESQFNPDAYNPAGGGQGARGIAQWRGERQTRLRQFAGTDKPTFEQQLAFIQHELGTTERAAFNELAKARTAEEAADVFLRKFERPDFKDYQREYQNRTRLAQGWARGGGGGGAPQVNQNTNININGAGDPETVARRVVEAQDRVNADLLRNLAGALR